MKGINIAVWFVAIAFAQNSFATNSVGRTQGSYATSPTGAATYSIPIWAPKGPNGVQPGIALTYNSRQGNGYVGVGWGVSGLSSIYRCNLTIAQDGMAAPVALATSDGYCMDGQRLRLTGGTYGTAGSSYQTEVANFVNVTAYGSAGNGPAYWQATDRNGWHYTYGQGGTTSNAQVLATGSTTADSWQLNEVKDPNGNTMTITYSTSNVAGLVVPHVISWVPESSGSSSYNFTMTFSYGTTGSVYGYVGGTPFNNTNILSSIAIAYQGTALKTYYLTYSNSSTATSRYLLTQIQECAGTGTSNCLSPTTVSWQAGVTGLAAAVALGGTVGTVVSTAFDLNGDGRNDLVMSASGAVYVAFGGAGGYATPVATGISSAWVAVGDIDGSGVAGMLVNVSGTWYYYKWNGSAFAGASTGISVATAANPVLADLDGDGRADFVYTDSADNVHVRLSTSTAGTVSFSSDINSGIGTSNFSIRAQTGGSNRALHFWGGAQADLLGTERTCAQYSTKNICVAYQYIYYTLHFTGSTFITGALPNTAIDFADYNDDGCTDVLTATQLLLSACNGSAPVPVALPTGVTAFGGMDWNGDGRRDVLVSQSNGNVGVVLSTGSGLSSSIINTSIPVPPATSYLETAPNPTGDGEDGLVLSSTESPYTLSYFLHNGAGQPPDLATEFVDGFGNSASPSYLPLTNSSVYAEGTNAVYPYMNYIGPLYAVKQATFSDPSSAGGTYEHTYTYFWGWMNLQGRGFAGFNGGITDTDSRTHVNRSPYYRTDFPYTGMLAGEFVSQPNTGSVFTSKLSNTPSVITLENTPNNQRVFPYVATSTSLRYELGGTENGDQITSAVTNFSYDNYGNATSIVRAVTDTDATPPYTGDTWTTSVTNTTDISANQTADVAAWCLSLLDETQITYSSTLSGSTSVTRTQTYTPDVIADCRIKTVVTEPTSNSGLYKVTEALAFDSFGNISSETLTGANMPSSPASRVTTNNWGATGQFLTTQTDPSGATTTWTYSSAQSLAFGVPDSVKNANNLTTSWGYDAFGRKSLETRPDGTSTTWTRSACTSYCGWSNSVYQIAQTAYQTGGTTAIRTDTNFYDPIDRVTETSGPTVTGATEIVQKLYNSLGLLAQQSIPFLSGATAYQQTYSYDALKRPLTITRPISSTNTNLQSTTFGYSGRTRTVKDPYSNVTTMMMDVNGNLLQTQDPVGYKVTRSYDAAGSLIGITDNVGNTLLKNVTYQYGIKPFLVASTDADRGTWTYTVDSLGERTSWKDAKGQSFSMSYDALSRPLTRSEPDLFTQWTWGSTPANHNVGQQIAECAGMTGTPPTACGTSPAYSETRTFDAAGRLSTRAITESGNLGNDPGGVFLFTLGYNSTTGLLNTLTYPISTADVALNIQYGYQYGLLQSITDTTDTTSTCGTTCTLWTANAMNGFGQITQETLGNGVVLKRTYDPVTSWLTAATGGVGGGAGMVNQSYLHDENGNVIQRQANNLGLTESYSYDADNRLTCVTLTDSGCSTPTFVYDAGVAGPGNITSQAGVGTYTYPAPGQIRPHAVSSITGAFNGISNPSFTYDGNGNMTGRAASANIAWSSYNYPTAISASDATGSEEVQLFYGPDRQRWEQIYTVPGTAEQTYYIGGLIDLVFRSGTTNFRHYIYARKEPVAVYSRTAAGVNTMSYILGDSRGSVTVIASDTGVPDIGESYTAFGVRRNPNTWSGAPATADLNTIAGISRQGFTFQTALGQSMGLNHMNGRVQDAILGRFLSPDPHVPDPTNAQSYNRYSYVNNNPLTLVDPTGFINKPYLSEGSPDSDSFDFTTSYNAVDGSFSGDGDGPNSSPAAPAGANSAATSAQDQGTAQGTDSNSSLDYIQITATKLTFDPTTGTVSVIINAGGTGGGFTPFANSANSASFDSERAIDAFNNASQAYAAGDLGEYGRQMDLYYKYSGCSCGPVYLNNPQTAGPLSPTGPPGVQIPSIQIPPIQISPPAPISP